MPEYEPLGLGETLGGNVDPKLVDLISKMLDYNPKRRIDPFVALSHPYFDELRAEKVSINGRPVVDLFDFREEEIGPH